MTTAFKRHDGSSTTPFTPIERNTFLVDAAAQIAVMVTVCELVSRGANLLIDDAIFLHKFVEIIRDENVHFGTACPCESS